MPSRAKAGLWAALLLQSALPTGEVFPALIDVAAEIGVTLMNISGGPDKDYILEANGNGAAFVDYDNDGDMDLLITNGSTIESLPNGGDPMVALYENVGGTYRDVSREAGLARTGWGMGVCVADYDNDGFRDFYLTAYGPNALYRNRGDGTFEDVTDTTGVGDTQWSTNCAFGDYDRDGYVDLYVANYVTFDEDAIPRRGDDPDCLYRGMHVFCGPLGLAGEPDTLYRNDGDGSFTDVTREAGIVDPGHYGFGVVFSDFDNDGWPDIYVANDSVPNLLFRNNQDGTFGEVGLVSGTSLDGGGRAQAGMGVAVGDYDHNGLFDIFVTNFAQDTNTLYRNTGSMFFNDATSAAGLGRISLPYLGWGTEFVDLDNDGYLDLFVANGHVVPTVDDLGIGESFHQRKELYRNLGNGRFREIATDLGGDLLEPKSARGAAFGDYDNDGDIDVVVVNMDDRPSVYRNDGGNANHWITLRLEGTSGNRDAVGARIEIEAAGDRQAAEVRSGGSYLSHNDMRIHFGLGSETRIDSVRIRWPGGAIEEFPGIQADRFVTIREGDGVVAVVSPP